MLLGISLLTACETAYYSAWEKIGVEKRDIMIDRIEEAQEAQEDGQEQFKDALEQFRSVVNYDGGNLEKVYDKLNGEYEDSVEAAEDIQSRIESVDDVAGDLFAEWKKEIGEFSDAKLRRDSEAKLTSTKKQYAQLRKSMRSAEKTMKPVLATLKDQVLYLKHNLNARAIASLEGELKSINADVDRLLKAMQKSIDESKSFIAQMKDA
jgi:hypothetical protein